jgi:3-hydroxyacyl-CoA dehydrogenase
MAAINEVIDLSIEDGVAVITSNHQPVNALSAIVRDGLTAAFDKALADDAIKAIVLTCAGRTFFAGADISEFGKPPKGASLHALFDKMENAAKPIVAAIHGTSLGGGFETALVCHYRVAVPSARVGLPEVKLGLLAGAGGTQRLPRIVGAAKALEMVTSGTHVGAADSLAMGLFDQLVPEGELLAGAKQFARQVVAEGRPLRKVRDADDKLLPDRGKPDLFAKFRAFTGFTAAQRESVEFAAGTQV